MASDGDSPYFDLSPTDRVMALLGGRSSAAPYFVFDLVGTLDRGALATALDLLAERHPILRCTVDPLAPRARWHPGTSAPELVVRAGAAGDHDGELDVRAGPTCRAIYDAGPHRHQLRFGVHHAVADAEGMLTLADDLRRFYCAVHRGQTPLVDVDWTPRNVGALLDASGVGWLDRLRLAWEAQQRWNALRPSTHADARGTGGPGGGPDRPFRPRFVSASLVDTAVAAGHDRDWRPNHVLLAALAVGWWRAIGHRSTRPSWSSWLVGVNCRRPLGAARGIGNLSGFEPLCVRDIETRSLPDLVDEVRARFVPFRRLGAGMVGELGAPLFELVPPRVLHQAMEFTFESRAAISRSTRIYSAVGIPGSLSDWADATAVAAWCEGGPRMAPPYIAVAVTRFRDEVAFTSVASNEVLSATEADALVDATREQLATLSEFARVPR